MNQSELSTILYYADFLSLKHTCTTVTDTCKYFFVFGIPMNIAYIVDQSPIYDENNSYFKQAESEYLMLKNKFGDEGVNSFIGNICNLSASGSVNAISMLKYIHRYSDKNQRDLAFKKYKEFKRGYKYTIPTIDEDGNEIEIECTKYVAHANAKKICKK